MIPYGRQWVEEEDIAAVTEVLRSDWLTTGPRVEAFERQVADFVGAKDAVAVSSWLRAPSKEKGATEIIRSSA